MRKTSFNSLRGKVARTCNAIVYDHMMRHFDEMLTKKQINELMKYAKNGVLDAMYEADQRLKKQY
jgi:acyl carrier protein phosphodiesterase